MSFIASATFAGARPGYAFRRGDSGVGYYPDAPGGGRAGEEDEEEEEEDDRGAKRRRVGGAAAARLDGDALLREAEAAAGARGAAVTDAKGLRKALSALKKRHDENTALRARHPDAPENFLESEVSLATELRKVSTVAATPALLRGLLGADGGDAGAPPAAHSSPFELLALLLSHENTDVAAEAIRMLREITDTDALLECEDGGDAPGLGPVGAEIVRRAAETCAPALVQNLSRMDEGVEAEAEAVDDILGFVENVAESGQTRAVDGILGRTKLMRFLLFRIQDRADDDDAGGALRVTARKAALADLLANLLAASEAARASLGGAGVESILVALSRFRKLAPRGEEAAELLESLSSALCSAMLLADNRLAFASLEGVQLALMLIRVRDRLVRRHALRVLDFALTRSAPVAEALVRADGGLGVAFAVFMGKVKYLAASEDGGAEAVLAGAVGVVFSLFQCTAEGSAERDRVAAKLVESDYEKCDRLVELYLECGERVAASVGALRRHAAAIPGEAATADDERAAAVGGGQHTLQQLALIIAHAWSTGHMGIRSRLLMLLRQRGRSLREVREVIDSFEVDIGDGDGEEAQGSQRERVRALRGGLREPEEEDEEEELGEGGDPPPAAIR